MRARSDSQALYMPVRETVLDGGGRDMQPEIASDPENPSSPPEDSDAADPGVAPKRLSKLQLFHVTVMIFFMGLQLTLPYTISVYMVRLFYEGESHSEQKVAQLSGILAASQSFFRSFSAYGWGILLDKVGRKIGALSGLVGCVLSLIFYGAASNYGEALIARSIPALLISGIPVAMKAMIGDVCDAEGQAIALGLFNIGHGAGSIVGPVLGGALSYPCERFSNFPQCQPGGILIDRPFLLPCLTSAAFGIITIVVTALLMKETHPVLSSQPGGWIRAVLQIICFCGGKKHDYERVQEEEQGDKDIEMEPQKLQKNSSDIETGGYERELQLRESGQETSSPKSRLEHSQDAKLKSGTENGIGNEDPIDPVVNQQTAIDTGDSESSAKEADADDEKWWKDKNVRLALLGSGLACLVINLLDELTPIFVSAAVIEGGLAMPLSEFTHPLAASGAFLIVYSVFLYPWTTKTFGPKMLSRLGIIASVPFAIMLPTASLFQNTWILQQILIYFAIVMGTIPKVSVMSSSMVLINIVTPKKTMGRVNGAGVTIQSAGRAAGPALSGTLWAAAVSLHIYGQQFLGFILVSIGCIATQFVFARITVPSGS